MQKCPQTVKMRKGGDDVPVDLGAFFADLAEARFDFVAMGDWINSVYENVIANTTVLDIWNGGLDSLSFLTPYITLVLLLGSLVVTFFGKKLAEPVKFVSIFVIAFCLGTCYISPLLDPFIELPHWIMGLIVAAVAAVLYKFIYIFLIVSTIGYSVYMVVYRADVMTSLLSGNVISAIAVAAVVLLVLFLLRKYAELIGFSVFGAWLTALSIRGFFDYTTWVEENGWILIVFLTVIIAIPGAIVQFKMQKKF